MGETDQHIGAIIYLRDALRYLLRDDAMAYVAANLMFYYEEGDASAVKAPDVFVAKGVGRQSRRTYRLWVEKVAPCVVIEVTSRKTRLEDMGSKRALYEMLGIGEYYLFDPAGEYLSPPLRGYHLVDGQYAPMALGPNGELHSPALGATLRPDGERLRVVDPQTGDVVPTHAEAMYRAAREAERAELEATNARREAERATAAEAELARLRAEIDRLQGRPPDA